MKRLDIAERTKFVNDASLQILRVVLGVGWSKGLEENLECGGLVNHYVGSLYC